MHSREPDASTFVRDEVPLTPEHSAGLVAVWEREDVGRVGFEWYLTGTQRLDDEIYASRSNAYPYFGALAERKFGRLRLFVNFENLGNQRQTKYGSLLRPTRRFNGRWTVDAWAPLDGFVVNGGFRISF